MVIGGNQNDEKIKLNPNSSVTSRHDFSLAYTLSTVHQWPTASQLLCATLTRLSAPCPSSRCHWSTPPALSVLSFDPVIICAAEYCRSPLAQPYSDAVVQS